MLPRIGRADITEKHPRPSPTLNCTLTLRHWTSKSILTWCMYPNIYIQIINLLKVSLDCKRIMTEKISLLHYFVCFQMHRCFIISVRNYILLKNYITAEGAVSHNVLYYWQLFIAHILYHISFFANNYFE